LNASTDAVLGFLRILKEDEVPIEEFATKLALIAERYAGMMERLGALDPEDKEALAFIEEAREILSRATSPGDYNRADELLSKAEEAQDRTLRRAEALEREAHESASRIRHKKVATRSERGQLSLIRLDYLQAAEHFRAAALLVSPDNPPLQSEYLYLRANALKSHGEDKGDGAVLGQAIDVYRDVLKELSPLQAPQLWAATQKNLALTLWKLGEREGKADRIEEAVAIYREALVERTQELDLPEFWSIQHNLALALTTLGDWEGTTDKLNEAVAAFREGLNEKTFKSSPKKWGNAQNSLGGTLVILGKRESGTVRFQEAERAYREALQVFTREEAPLDWAMVKMGLGVVLRNLGERERSVRRLQEAVAVFREALMEWPRNLVPLDWAKAMSNLGNALATLGELEGNSTKLREAADIRRHW